MEFSNKLEQIELKLRQLALKIERLEKAKNDLLEENQQLKSDLKKRNDTIDALELQLKKTNEVLELKQMDEPESTKKVRKELDRYIKEIDKCIEWLDDKQEVNI